MESASCDYVVALVFSGWKLSKIFNFFTDYLDAKTGDIGVSKIERYKDKKTGEMRDSNRTVILLDRYLFEKAIKAGLDVPQHDLDFRIAEYFLTEKNFPPENYSSNLFILIPKYISPEEAEMILEERLKYIASFDLLSDWTLKIPLESRLSGEHRGCAYLSFSENMPLSSIALVKVLLHDSFIFFETLNKLYHLPVFWAKNKDKNKDKDKKDKDQKNRKVTKILKRDEW